MALKCSTRYMFSDLESKPFFVLLKGSNEIPHKIYVKVLLYSSSQLKTYFNVAPILAILQNRLRKLTSLELIEEYLVKNQTNDTNIILISSKFYILQCSHKHRSHLEIQVAERDFKLSRLILLKQLTIY